METTPTFTDASKRHLEGRFKTVTKDIKCQLVSAGTQLLLRISVLPQEKHIYKSESRKNVPQLLSFTRKSRLRLPSLSGWQCS